MSAEHNIEEEKLVNSIVERYFYNIHSSSKNLYRLDLIKWLGYQTYIVDGEKGFYFKAPTFIDPDNLIKSQVVEMGLCNTEYSNRAEITEISNKIAQQLIEGFRQFISTRKREYFIALLTMLECNVLDSTFTLVWFNDKFRKGIDKFNYTYDFARIIGDTFSYLIEENSPSFNNIFKDWEGYLGLDKISLQIIIEIVADYLDLEDEEDATVPHSEIDIEKVLLYTRAIGQILKIRDDTNNEILSLQKIEIDNNGVIKVHRQDDFEESYDNFQNEVIYWMENKEEKTEISNAVLEDINRLSNQFLGLTIDEIKGVSAKLLDYYNSNTWIISKTDIFSKKIKEFFSKDEGTIERFLGHFIRIPLQQDDYTDVKTVRFSRPLRKCLIPFYKDWFICPTSIFYYGLTGLCNDIFDGYIEDEEFNRRIQKFHEQIDIEFEEKVVKRLRESYNSPVANDIHKVYIGEKGDFIIPPGQIDILFLFKGNLFVIECKNFALRTNTQATGNEIQKTKKTISRKLQKKIDFVRENLDKFLPILGVSKDTEINDVRGIIVTNKFTLTQIIKEVPFAVINYAQLINWFDDVH
ncbi:hypothetical protein C1I58_06305 [Bacillus sp. PIC28]|nr:hypothetical protein C1I58_06305 [Bacillus sp. PIC28]